MRTMRVVALVRPASTGRGNFARNDEAAHNGTIVTMWPVLEDKMIAGKNDATISELRNEFTRIQIAGLEMTMKEWPPIYARHFTVDEFRTRRLPSHASRL